MQQTQLSDFKVINKLGEGSFSNVYKVIRISDNQQYAMKKVKMNILKGKEKENAINEVRLLASINSKHIVAYKDAFIDNNCLYVIMEFCKNGDLQGKINKHIKQRTQFTEQEIIKAMKHMTQGLQDLHNLQIMHRDLKCANVFIDEEGNYKLGDLNVSKLSKKGGLAHTQTGTPYYASPEIWSDKPYNNKCDIWSLGCVTYEMAALKPPFRAQDMEGLYRKIRKGVFERIPKQYSGQLQNLIQICLKVQPFNRPDTEQLLKNEYLVQNENGNILQDNSNQNDKKSQLLNTIKLPKNLFMLNNGQLPKSQYKQLGSQECPEFKSKENLDSINEENEEKSEKNNINKNRRQRIISAGPRGQILITPQSQNKKNDCQAVKLPIVQKYDHRNNNKIENDVLSNLSQQYQQKQQKYQQQRKNRPESEKIIKKPALIKQNSKQNVQKSYDYYNNKENINNNNQIITKIKNSDKKQQKIGYERNNSGSRPQSAISQQYKPKFDYNEMLKQKLENKENQLLGNPKLNLDKANMYKPPINRYQSAKNAQESLDILQSQKQDAKIYLKENKNYNKNYDMYNYCHNVNKKRQDIQNQSRQQIYYKHHKLF